MANFVTSGKLPPLAFLRVAIIDIYTEVNHGTDFGGKITNSEMILLLWKLYDCN